MKFLLPKKKIRFSVSTRSVIAAALIAGVINLTAIPMLVSKAKAATLTQASLTIGDSRASVTTSHAFVFTTASTGTIDHIDFQYCTTASGSCSAPTGLDITTPGTPTVNNIGAGTVSNSGSTLTYTITTPASVGNGTAISISFPSIVNPSTINTAFYVRITTKDGGSAIIDGPTAVAAAILDTNSLAASATVDSTLSFSVAGVASGGTTAGNQTTDITTTASTIPFGDLIANSTKTGATDLTVITNANNGYTVTVKSADPPLADVSKNIDKFSAGSNAAPAAWVGGTTNNPTGTSPSVNTGFFGYTTNDASLGTGTATRFTSSNNMWAGSDLQTPEEVAYNAGSTSGSGDTVRVGWRVEVNNFQPNGSYTGTITLVATPTF